MKKVKISIDTNPVFEMLVSLNRIADSDQMESSYFENAGYSPHPRMTEIIEEIKNSLSLFYRQEIVFFFSKPVCSLLWELVISEKIRDVSQLSNMLAALSDDVALRYLLADVIDVLCQQEGEICQNEQAIEAMLADRPAFEQRITDCPSLSSADQEKALEFLRYPADAKQRLVRLLERYAQVFAPYVAELETLDHAEMEKSRKAYLANAETFITSYLKINVNILEPAKRIDLIPNAFSEILTFVLQPEKDRFVLIYGTFISKKRSREKRSEERKQFFKVLSEEKRVDIIKSLAVKPAIGSDLAKQIGLTSATASYHLTMLLGIGLVEYERIGQKLHYILNKEMLKDLFDKAYQDLVNQ
ncbi:MAG: winged helix-turn-helix transcriptional regulator [Clostridiaceae bacterium]|jgi:DNA-binding transcriptional ArsR family regulator|nr:winged helix-turn-helix transcriptional regulator [Clostridiaceae bacterium]